MTSSNCNRSALALLVLLLTVALLPACRGTKKDASVAEQNRPPSILAQVPADTFVFFGTSEPMPDEVVESVLSSLESLRKVDEQADDEDYTGLEDAIDEQMGGTDDEEDDGDDWGGIVLEQMGGEFTTAGLERIGVDPNVRFALYGLGNVPVFRLGLSDPDKFRELVDKLESQSDEKPVRREVAGVVFWETKVEDDEDDAEAANATADTNEPEPTSYELMRITDHEVIIAEVDEANREQALPYFLGIKEPAESLATSGRVDELAARHGLEKWLVMFIDIDKLVDFAEDTETEPATVTERITRSADLWSKYSDACRKDVARLLEPATLIYGGLREYSDDATEVVGGLELQQDAARRLSELRAGAPGYSTRLGQGSLFMLGWGVRTDKLVELVSEMNADLQSDPLECEELQSLNSVGSSFSNPKASVPSWASAIHGFSLMLHSIGFDIVMADDGESTEPIFTPRALAILQTEQPDALNLFLKRYVPEMSGQTIEPNGIPVPIPGSTADYEGLVEPMLFMTEQGFGVSIGEAMSASGVEALGQDEPVTSPIFVLRANVGDSVRLTLDELDEIIAVAAENREERGLTEQDIATSKKLVADLREMFGQRRLVAGFTIELDEYGVLMSYRKEGAAWDTDWDEQFSGFEQRFDALGRVLGFEDDAEQGDDDDHDESQDVR